MAVVVCVLLIVFGWCYLFILLRVALFAFVHSVFVSVSGCLIVL